MAAHVPKMPDLATFVGVDKKSQPRRKMSWQEMMANMNRWRIVLTAQDEALARRRSGPHKKPKPEQKGAINGR